MLKKATVMLASKYFAIKAKMKAIETRLIIHLLLLQDKKVIRHLFRHRRYLNLPNMVEGEDYQSANNAALTNVMQLAEEKMEIEEVNAHSSQMKYFDLSNITVEDTTTIAAATTITAPVSIVQVEIEEDEESPYLRHDEDHSVSVIEMVKNAKEGQGKEFRLEDDIDQVADLFIRRFHHQIRLQPPL